MMLLAPLIALVVFALAYHFYWKRRGLPPGPTPLPFIGNLFSLFLHEPGYEAFRIWKQKYGRCFTFWMGPRPAVVLADYELIKDTIVKDGAAYTGRMENPFSRTVRGGNYGIIESSGALWQQHRRFALHVFRDFGMGKDVMEERVLVEVSDLLRKCAESRGSPINLRSHIDAAVGSVINGLLFGYRFDENNMEEFLTHKAMFTRIGAQSARPDVILWMLFPAIRSLPIFWRLNEEARENKKVLFSQFDEQIAKHKKEIEFDNEESTDYVEAYLKEQKRLEHEPDNGGFSNDQLRNMCLDLWMAGLETTSNTLYWGVLYVLLHPEVQKKMHAELDLQIGSSRQITMSDRGQLHYINAVISEIQRVANLLPLNVFRETTSEVIIDGFIIPSGTLVAPQISTVMYDEKVFPGPYDFKPSRHLSEDGAFVKIDQMIPFSQGKRQCLGEGIARMELFLILANFFNRFEVSQDGDKRPSTVKKFGNTMRAEDYTVVLKERH